MQLNDEYTASDLKVLEGLEIVRKRPVNVITDLTSFSEVFQASGFESCDPQLAAVEAIQGFYSNSSHEAAETNATGEEVTLIVMPSDFRYLLGEEYRTGIKSVAAIGCQRFILNGSGLESIETESLQLLKPNAISEFIGDGRYITFSAESIEQLTNGQQDIKSCPKLSINRGMFVVPCAKNLDYEYFGENSFDSRDSYVNTPDAQLIEGAITILWDCADFIMGIREQEILFNGETDIFKSTVDDIDGWFDSLKQDISDNPKLAAQCVFSKIVDE